jgi:S-(hydroxymethyl)glutathione dehydrogenase / alcohol dehydrogenase
MRAAVLTQINEPMPVEEVTPVDPGPSDVLVRVTASGVCHSDLSVHHGYIGDMTPIVLGHEGTGIIEAVGSDVTGVKAGDRVIATFIPACGHCWWCLRDQTNLCERSMEVSAVPRFKRSDGSVMPAMTGLGTFAEAMTVADASVVKVETDLPDEQLALIGCGVTTGVGAALNTARIVPGSSVAVIGCGGVGQSVVQGARIAGAGRIIAVDPVELKRKTSEQLGATDLVDPGAGDPVEQVKALTGGRGVDYAFEVIGLPETVQQAFLSARRGGTVVVVGMPRIESQVTLPGFPLFYEEKKILGCLYGSAQVRRDFARLIGLVETGRLDIGAMVSRRIKLDEVNDAFRAMEAGEVIRSVIV